MTRDVMILLRCHTMRADRLVSIVLLLQANGRMTAGRGVAAGGFAAHDPARHRCPEQRRRPGPRRAGHGRGLASHRRLRDQARGLTPAEIRCVVPGAAAALLAELGIEEAARRRVAQVACCLTVGVRGQAEFVRQRLLDRSRRLARLCRVADELAHDCRGAMGRPPLEVPVRENRRRIERSQVDPLGLVARGNHWYLVATKATSDDLPRVADSSAEILAEPCVPPTGFDLAAYCEARRIGFAGACAL